MGRSDKGEALRGMGDRICLKVSKNSLKNKKKKKEKRKNPKPLEKLELQWRASEEDEAQWFTHTFHSACASVLSPLERDPIPVDSVVKLSPERSRSCESLGWHIKRMFGESWQDVLCKGEDGNNKEKGSPALLILCSSAMRCVELLKALRNLTKECRAAKLFAKHIKVDEQVSTLEGYVNIAAGTPNRVKKLLDLGALGLGRLSVLFVDMNKDAKGLTLLTVPQVKMEFWELYREHFHQLVLDKRLQLCLY
eukprot:c20494_g1_i3 orf=460-1212(-)